MTSTKRKELVAFSDIMKQYDPHRNTSKNVLTLYEKTALLSLRMEQLANGAPSYLSEDRVKELNDIKKIAMEELVQKKLPFMVSRAMPNGIKEYWRLQDLLIL